MHLNIDANVNEKVPEIGFPYPLTGELRLTSAVEATAIIGKQTVKLEAGKTSLPVNVEGLSAILVKPSDKETQGTINVTLTDAIAELKEKPAPAPVRLPEPQGKPGK